MQKRLLKPVMSARTGTNNNEQIKSHIQQTLDLCMVVDKNRLGRVSISNFMRISSMSGLKVNNLDLMKFTNERSDTVDYSGLTTLLLQRANG